jgi:hypothetical protein
MAHGKPLCRCASMQRLGACTHHRQRRESTGRLLASGRSNTLVNAKNACISLHLFVHEAVPGVYVENEVTPLAEIMTHTGPEFVRFDGLPRSTYNGTYNGGGGHRYWHYHHHLTQQAGSFVPWAHGGGAQYKTAGGKGALPASHYPTTAAVAQNESSIQPALLVSAAAAAAAARRLRVPCWHGSGPASAWQRPLPVFIGP